MVCCVLAIRIMRDGEIRGKEAQRKENRGEAPRPRVLGRDPAPAGGHQREAERCMKASRGPSSLCWAVNSESPGLHSRRCFQR